MSIASNFPAISPSLNLSFALTKALDPRITFTRASTATYYGTETAKAEENLLLFSQEFDNAGWAKTNATVTANTEVAPNGTTTAETFDDGVVNAAHNVSQTIVTTSGSTNTLSAFLKNGTRQFAILAVSGSTTSFASAKFDLDAGTLGSTSSSGTGYSVVSSSITSVGNDWYRCTITFVVGTTTSNAARIGMGTDGTTFTASQRGLEVYTGTNATIFAWGAQLEQRSAVTNYTPTTTQTITNFIPVLENAASGEARFDHNPTTFESLGLLIEESRTNLLLRSEEFDNAGWTKTDITVTANNNVAPNGTLTADLLTEGSAGNAGLGLPLAITVPTSASVTCSVYVKRSALVQLLRLNIVNGTGANGGRAWFDIQNGVLGTAQNIGTGTATSGSITAVGNSWHRLSVTTTLGSGDNTASFSLNSASADNSFTRVAGAAYWAWGAQLEAGAFATSFIPTTTAQVTRAADAASMTGANFSSWYNQAEGSFYVDAAPQVSNAVGYALFEVNDATAANRIGLFKLVTTGNASMAVLVGGATQVSTNNGAWTVSGKFVSAYAVDNFASVLNGGAAATDTSGTLPVVTQATIGARGDGDNRLTGTISKISYYPLRVTNAQLQGLTS